MPARDGNEIIRIPKGELLMLNVVLIHGSWHTGAHWTPVVGHLHQSGHQALAPTVLGHGEGVEKRVNHVQQVDHLVNQLIQLAEVGEVADLLLYLESAPFVNGAVIHLDGGAHAGKW